MSSPQEKGYLRWSYRHAWMMLAATAAFFIEQEFYVYILLSAGSFLVLIFQALGREYRGKFPGAANLVTLARLAGIFAILLLPQRFPPAAIAGGGFLILLADGLDGWLARRREEASLFGEYLDKETDAFLLHSLALLTVYLHRLGPWIVLAGALRYLFVIFLRFYPTPLQKERRWRWGRIIFVTVILALISAFLPLHPFYIAANAAGLGFLCYSFGRDILWIFGRK